MTKQNFALIGLSLIWMGTTYILKDGNTEVGRLVENDGKDQIVAIDQSQKQAIAVPAQGNSAVAAASPKLPPAYPWYFAGRGYKTALWEQKRSHMPVLLYFYADWCPYCKAFDSKILDNPKVKQGMSRMLKVKIEAEKEMAISEKYGITSFPRVLVVAETGGDPKRIKTHTDPEQFLKDLKAAGFPTA